MQRHLKISMKGVARDISSTQGKESKNSVISNFPSCLKVFFKVYSSQYLKKALILNKIVNMRRSQLYQKLEEIVILI